MYNWQVVQTDPPASDALIFDDLVEENGDFAIDILDGAELGSDADQRRLTGESCETHLRSHNSLP